MALPGTLLANRIAAAHYGTLTVESPAGQRVRVTLALPMKDLGEKTGLVAYDLDSANRFLCQQAPEEPGRVYSEATAERVDEEVEQLLERAYQQANATLTKRRAALALLRRRYWNAIRYSPSLVMSRLHKRVQEDCCHV